MDTIETIKALQVQAVKQGIMIDQLSLLIGRWLLPEQLQALRVSVEALSQMADQQMPNHCFGEDLEEWLQGIEAGSVHQNIALASRFQ